MLWRAGHYLRWVGLALYAAMVLACLAGMLWTLWLAL